MCIVGRYPPSRAEGESESASERRWRDICHRKAWWFWLFHQCATHCRVHRWGGTGASGTAQVVNGRVTGVTITSAGSGYTHAPRVFFRTASAFQVIATTSANATTFTDSPGTGTYIYTVTAINTSGQSPSANIVLVTVP